MPTPENVAIPVASIGLTRAGGEEVTLGSLAGVNVVVLVRHRH